MEQLRFQFYYVWKQGRVCCYTAESMSQVYSRPIAV